MSGAGVAGGAYRTVWRWHGYAGLAVLPLLAWLAITGGLYLYKGEIERLVYADWIATAPATAMPLDAMIARVEGATGGQVTQVARPAAADESWRMTIQTSGGERRTAFVRAGDGAVLGTTTQGGVMATVRSLHSLIITGPIGNALVEIVAGWTILLVASGLYLWWPRRGQPALALRGRPAGRLFWRDLHASLGILLGGILLFLAVTGMPWSGMWGKGLQTLVAAQGWGRPRAPGPAPWEVQKHEGHASAEAKASLPWSLQERAMPHAMHAGPARITPGRALAIAERRGLAAPWTLSLPATAQAPYLVSAVATQAGDARALYLDAGDGRVLQDARYAQFGTAAQAIEWGIAVHEGREYGGLNRAVMTLGCLAALLLSISAATMWWKRRRAGATRTEAQVPRGLVVLTVASGILFPLTGLTMLVLLAFEGATGRLRRATG